jgi:hypothetical protein
MRPLASRPEWGLVLGTTTAVNQRGEMVFCLTIPCSCLAAILPLEPRKWNLPLRIGS